MNNKGFIATSLIYSFFLIFITLFLTIIADYLQNKVLLNTIENGIKDNINNTKSIEDFDVGDIINNVSGSEIYGLPNNSYWVIASIIFDNKSTPEDESSLILYNLIPQTVNTNAITKDIVKNDLESYGNYNDTIINELLTSPNEEYIFQITPEIIINPKCSKINLNILGEIDVQNSNCSTIPSASKYIIRKNIDDWNDKKVLVNPDGQGGFNLTGEVTT